MVQVLYENYKSSDAKASEMFSCFYVYVQLCHFNGNERTSLSSFDNL